MLTRAVHTRLLIRHSPTSPQFALSVTDPAETVQDATQRCARLSARHRRLHAQEYAEDDQRQDAVTAVAHQLGLLAGMQSIACPVCRRRTLTLCVFFFPFAPKQSSGSATPPCQLVPTQMHGAFQRQTEFFNYLSTSHELWEQADTLVYRGHHTGKTGSICTQVGHSD